MCVDLRSLNANIWVDRYPLPNINEMLAVINGAKFFSVLDLTSAYYQVPLHPESQVLTAFTTPFGTYKFLRMPFGLASAPSAFQRIMQHVLTGAEKSICFQDDILIYGSNEEEHDRNLSKVCCKPKEAGLTIKRDKCKIGVALVEFLGHTLSNEGMKPKMNLIESVVGAPTPANKDELKSFLGLAEYMSKFVKKFSEVVQPIRDLLKKGTEYVWLPSHEKAFRSIKSAIAAAPSIGNFECSNDTILTTDASNRDIGATLSQMQNGKEKIIAFASRTLTEAEINYSTIEKEALSCYWATNHFKCFLWGIPFKIRTDHKPLVSLFASMACLMQSFNFAIEYVPGHKNQIADCLSRLPIDSLAKRYWKTSKYFRLPSQPS